LGEILSVSDLGLGTLQLLNVTDTIAAGMLNRKNLSQIKCIVAEIDGVLTDGKTWLNHHGHKQRKFSVRDSLAIRRLIKAGYSFAVATSNVDDEILEHFERIGVKTILPISNGKVDVAQFLLTAETSLNECALMHFNPIENSQTFGISVTVSNSPQEVRTSVQHVTGSEAGEGAISEFSQLVLDHGSYSSQMTARKAANL
jgi:3-deoxy-D-manno-octulosonate 8-phosphate phosphatase (KDO 8-P phosphatase)